MASFVYSFIFCQGATVSLPKRSRLQQADYILEGSLVNVADLQILHNAQLLIYDTAHINSNEAKLLWLNSLEIHNGGTLSQVLSLSLVTLNFTIQNDLHIFSGGILNINSFLVSAKDLSVDVAGLISAAGRGYASGAGPGKGVGSLSGGPSGGGHGGSGGAGKDHQTAGKAYGSFMVPDQYGSGGGYGLKRQVRDFENSSTIL